MGVCILCGGVILFLSFVLVADIADIVLFALWVLCVVQWLFVDD